MTKKFLLPLIAALALGSCSDIAENERLIEIDSVTPQRAVLLEEFTGQNCPNCPAAHRELAALTAQYPDALIPVSIHAGAFGISCTARRPGLMQPEGDSYNDRYGIKEWPKGVIDGSSGPLNADHWGNVLRDELKKPSDLVIELGAEADQSTPAVISVDIKLRPTADIDGTLYVWVLEDGIVARQIDKEQGGTIADYVHDHVYRAAVNGIEGEPVSLKAGIHKDLSHSMAARATEKETWNTERLSIVAFVRLADGSVEQAARCAVAASGASTDEQ